MASADRVIAKRGPYEVTLEAGKTYYYCTCGRSKNQPFCDGSHKKLESGIRPLPVTVDETRTAFLCGCKQTSSEPFCDGSHAKLPKVEKKSKGSFCVGKLLGAAVVVAAIAAVAVVVVKKRQ